MPYWHTMSYEEIHAHDIRQSQLQRLHWPKKQECNGGPLSEKQNRRHTVSTNKYKSRVSTDCCGLCKGAQSDGVKHKSEKRMPYLHTNYRKYKTNNEFSNPANTGYNRAGHYHYITYHSNFGREGTEVHRRGTNSNNQEGSSTEADECVA
eukprot:14976475-Heterocapsa_arctica.AAC.1